MVRMTSLLLPARWWEKGEGLRACNGSDEGEDDEEE